MKGVKVLSRMQVNSCLEERMAEFEVLEMEVKQSSKLDANVLAHLSSLI